MKKLFGFTLAEVVLTMSIVGVVAAMTIPTLHYNRIKKEYTAKLKNFYSHMENAIVDMQVDKGAFQDMNYDQDGSKKVDGKDVFDWYMDTIDPYMGHQYVDTTYKAVYFKDGSMIQQIYPGACLDVHYDVNGDKGPNRLGYDNYIFLFCFDDVTRQYWFGNKDIFFGTYGGDINSSGTTRAQMVEKCKTEGSEAWCSRLLQNDNWEFKSDYPYKF